MKRLNRSAHLSWAIKTIVMASAVAPAALLAQDNHDTDTQRLEEIIVTTPFEQTAAETAGG